MDSYSVKAPLVVIGNPDGRDWYLYAGQAVPDDVDEATRDRLVKAGLFVANPATQDGLTHDEPASVAPKPGSRHRPRRTDVDPG